MLFYVADLDGQAHAAGRTKSGAKNKETSKGLVQSTKTYPLAIHWQVMRSRPQASLAGTITETYQVQWELEPGVDKANVHSTYARRVEGHWSPDASDPKLGRLTVTRGELVKLLGMEQELPQDGRVWDAEAPVAITVQDRSGRLMEQIFRHADDNGMVMIRLSARLLGNE